MIGRAGVERFPLIVSVMFPCLKVMFDTSTAVAEDAELNRVKSTLSVLLNVTLETCRLAVPRASARVSPP